MTPPHPRDPRARRGLVHAAPRVDPLAAAVRLDLAADAMRAALTGPEPDDLPPPDLAGAIIRTAHLVPPSPDEVRIAVGDPFEPPPPVPSPAPGAFSAERSRPVLTWRSRHDERSRLYAAEPAAGPMRDVVHDVGPILDQREEGMCVGAATAVAVNALRLAGRLTGGGLLGYDEALELYLAAQRADEVPGEDYTGTSVLGGMKAGVAAGLFGGYLWAFGTRVIARQVQQSGPVVIGIPWLSGMYETGPGGLVGVAGEDQGMGHALCVAGFRRTGPQGQPGPFFGWANTWGTDYGDNGWGWIHHRDLAGLLRGRGEAAIPTAEPQTPR
jgi:hypothetical protein